MPSQPLPHPASHAQALQAVLHALPVLAGPLDDEQAQAALRQQGYSARDAERLVLLVPSALAWIVCERLGATGFPDHFVIHTPTGQTHTQPVVAEHYFTAALTLAHEVFTHGWRPDVSQDTYQAVAARSAEMDAANRILEQGGSLQGASLAPLQLHLHHDAPQPPAGAC